MTRTSWPAPPSILRKTSAFVLTFALLSLGTSPLALQSRDGAIATSGTATVRGRVVTDDDAARPVRRAIVTLSGVASGFSRTTATDVDGRFLFANLPVGDVTLTAAKAGFLTSYYGAPRPGHGPAVPLATGDGARESDITIRLTHGGAVTGTIFGVTGRPQAGVLVTALQPDMANGRRTPAVPAGNQSGFTDDHGRYRIWGLGPGGYIIAATPLATAGARMITSADLLWATEQTIGPESVGDQAAARRAPDAGRVVSYAPVFYPGVVDPAGSEVITIGPAEDRAGVDITLQVVSTAAVNGTVLGLNGRPVANVQVSLANTAASPMRGSSGSETDAEGRFAFRSVAPGEFTVSARASRVPSMFDLWASLDVAVNGEDQNGLVLGLRPGMTVSGHIVYDGSAKPPDDLSRVAINLAPTSHDSGVAPLSQPVLADGTFTLLGVVPGRYRLSAILSPSVERSSGSAAPWFLKSALWNGQDILDSALEVVPGQDVSDLTVVFGARPTDLSGTLVDMLNRPAADYVVVVFPTDRRLWTEDSRRIRQAALGSDGRFRFGGLPSGEYYLGAVSRADLLNLSDTTLLEEVARVALRATLADGEQKVQNLRLGGAERSH
jgi:protocatechuate 3,4-dioxygenase beta subunit